MDSWVLWEEYRSKYCGETTLVHPRKYSMSLKGAISKVAFQPSFLKGHVSLRVNIAFFILIFEFSTDWEITDLEQLGFESMCFYWGFPLGCSTVGCRFVPNKHFRKRSPPSDGYHPPDLNSCPGFGFDEAGRILSQPWIQPGLFSTGRNDSFWVGAQPGKPRKALFLRQPCCWF